MPLPDSATVTRVAVAHAVASAPVQLALFGALVCTVGAVAFHFAVLPRCAFGRAAAEAAPSADTRVATFGLSAASLGGVALLLRILEQLGDLADPADVRGAGALAGIKAAFPLSALIATHWGRAAVIGVAAFALVAAGCWRARRGAGHGGRRGWHVTAAGALILTMVPAWLGHGAADETSPWLSPLADALHVAAASVWLGGLAVVAMLAAFPAVSTRATPDEHRGDALLALGRAFSPVALAAGALVLVSGIVSGWLRLRPALAPIADGNSWPAALRATGVYGAVLAAKGLVAAAVAAVGAWNWRRGTLRLAAARDDGSLPAATLRAGAAWELALAGVTLAITAALVAMPPPSR